MSAVDDERAAGIEPPVPDSIDEALILWQFCSRLADRIWECHEAALIERLMREEQGRRCEDHPWERRPCRRCVEPSTPDETNLELAFGSEYERHR